MGAETCAKEGTALERVCWVCAVRSRVDSIAGCFRLRVRGVLIVDMLLINNIKQIALSSQSL